MLFRRWNLLFLLPASLARAGDDGMVPVCPSVPELETQMMSCGDNYYAAEKAEECADTIKESWKAAAAKLQKILATQGRHQSDSEAVAAADYKKAMAATKAQIEQMQAGTALVAAYPEVMINFPDAADEEASLSCFNEAFDRVQKAVSDLDDEIIAAKKVYEEAERLKVSSSSHETKLNSSLVKGVQAGKRKVASQQKLGAPGKRPKQRASDITSRKWEK